MIAVDTNVVIRLLTRDDEAQFKKAHRLFSEKEIFLPDTVILESEWVLRYAYEFTPATICEAFEKLCGLPSIHLANPHLVSLAIAWHKQGLDFADALHLAQCQPYSNFMTFDTKLVRKAKGLGKCKVKSP